MKWTRAPAQVAEAFAAAVPEHPAVSQRKMFGYPCAFVNGNMFTGVFGSDVFVRLGDDALQQLVREGGAAAFEPMPGRPMRGYSLVPEAALADPAALRVWMKKSLDFGLTLPAKEKKPRAAKTAGGSRATTKSR